MHRSHPLAALLSGMDQEGAAPTPNPIPEAQIAELLICLRENGSPPATFTRGDRVEYKHGRGPLTPQARQELVLIYWRTLEPDTSAEDCSRANRVSSAERDSMPFFNCMIAHMQAGVLVFMLAETSALRNLGSIIPAGS
jgi:hypothetical protein